jgi:hypothetical protein
MVVPLWWHSLPVAKTVELAHSHANDGKLSGALIGKMLATQPDLPALLSSVPQLPLLFPSTFYLLCKLAGLKRSLSGPVALDLIGKLGPDHQLSPGYDCTIHSYPDFPYPYEGTIRVQWYRHTYPHKGLLIYKDLPLMRVQLYSYKATAIPLWGYNHTLIIMRIQPYPHRGMIVCTLHYHHCEFHCRRCAAECVSGVFETCKNLYMVLSALEILQGIQRTA